MTLPNEPTTSPKPEPDAWTRDERDRWWVFIAGPPFFAVLAIELVLLTEGSVWNNIGLFLGAIVFWILWTVGVSKNLLVGLAQRGQWVPPGATRRPYLVAFSVPLVVHGVLGLTTYITQSIMRACGLLS